MTQAIITIMMFFMLLGVADKIFLGGRFGYGREFEKGIETMGPLTLMMAGIMCGAPALGSFLAPVLTPLFQSIGADPGMIGGMLLAVDMGGFPLAQALSLTPDALMLSGVLLASTLGTAMTFTIPVGLAMCKEDKRGMAAKGIVIGIIASPLSMLTGGLLSGIALKSILLNALPPLLLSLLLAFCLITFQDKTIKFFLCFAKLLTAVIVLLLALSILDHMLGIKLIDGLEAVDTQIKLIGDIAIMLSGAYPFVYFIQKNFHFLLKALAGILHVDASSACGLIISLANPLPMFAMTGEMSARGTVLVFAFMTPVLCLLGDHLGYISAIYPAGISALLTGKFSAALLALLIAFLSEKKRDEKI